MERLAREIIQGAAGYLGPGGKFQRFDGRSVASASPLVTVVLKESRPIRSWFAQNTSVRVPVSVGIAFALTQPQRPSGAIREGARSHGKCD